MVPTCPSRAGTSQDGTNLTESGRYVRQFDTQFHNVEPFPKVRSIGNKLKNKLIRLNKGSRKGGDTLCIPRLSAECTASVIQHLLSVVP